MSKLEIKDPVTSYMYVSGNGQLVIDAHESDEAHLLAAQTRDAQPMYDCRTYLDRLFPEAWRGRRVTVIVARELEDDGTVATVHLSVSAGRTAAPGDLPGEPSR